ncbi:unnamed protein product [Didymodactylos carnosus]|uniref:Uncharacterized protein n=1 Tax=Didymodactylos carnosus TaxID=1234261 RepID=A0A8S2ISN7_9BILA|nr:unnamed protein product [Didymodactylos carnosus]CAF3755480.1 unnamed protein product [Didymodactylos carnosus]
MPPVEERLRTVALQTKENDEQASKLEKALNLLKIQTSKLKSSQGEIEQLKSDHQQQSILVDMDDCQTQTEFIKRENNNHYTQTDITKLQSTECQIFMCVCQLVDILTYDEYLDKSVNDEDETEEVTTRNQLNDELSSMSLDKICDYLSSESYQTIARSKLNFTELQTSQDQNEFLLRLCYLAYRCYQIQLQSYEAKHLYNEGYIRVLKDEYQLLNSEKNDLFEQLTLVQQQNHELQTRLDKSKDERHELNSKHDDEIAELKSSYDKFLEDIQQQHLLKYELCEQLSIELKQKYMNRERGYIEMQKNCDYFRQEFERLKNIELTNLEQNLNTKQELDLMQREKETLEELNLELFQYKVQFQQQHESDMESKLSSTGVAVTSIHEQEDDRCNQMNQYREELENQYQMKREHLLALKNQQQQQQEQMDVDTQTNNKKNKNDQLRERDSLVEQQYEQLKQLEKQYQEKLEEQKTISNVETEILKENENKKLKELRSKLNMMALDYLNENERLKRENEQSLSSKSSRSLFASSTEQTDQDICQLIVQLLTCEVALQTTSFENLENLFENDSFAKCSFKKPVENYTLQFKHVQHEMNDKIQEILTLKKEIDRLRASELQYRIEVDCLKTEFQGVQLTCKQLQRELADLKLSQPIVNEFLMNLRAILELKERELKALKDKVDHTSKTHQLEINELHQTNQVKKLNMTFSINKQTNK